eukprot:112352-Prymnesium_polylepis.1
MLRKACACKLAPATPVTCISMLSLQLMQLEAAIVCLPIPDDAVQAAKGFARLIVGVGKSIAKMSLDDDLLAAAGQLAAVGGRWMRRKFAPMCHHQLLEVERFAASGRSVKAGAGGGAREAGDKALLELHRLVSDICFSGAGSRWEARACAL